MIPDRFSDRPDLPPREVPCRAELEGLDSSSLSQFSPLVSPCELVDSVYRSMFGGPLPDEDEI